MACSNPQQQLRACYRLIAKMPTLAAMAYKTSIGQVRRRCNAGCVLQQGGGWLNQRHAAGQPLSAGGPLAPLSGPKATPLLCHSPALTPMLCSHAPLQPIIYPRNDLNYAENFLHMMFAGEGAGEGRG